MRPEPAITDLAARLIPVPQDTSSPIHELIRRGKAVQLSPRRAVTVRDYLALEEHHRWTLKVLAIGQSLNRAVLIGCAAARLHGMWTVGGSIETRVPVALTSGKRPPRTQWPAGCEYRSRTLDPSSLAIRMGLRVTNPIDTWLEIAREQGFKAALVAADWLLKNGYSKDALTERLEAVGRFIGVKDARRSLTHAVANSGSPWESYARGLLIEAGFRDIVTQAPMCGQYEVDLLVNGCVVAEIDGDVKYSTNAADVILAERKREKRIRNTGVGLVRVSPSELWRSPGRFVQEVSEAVSRHKKLL